MWLLRSVLQGCRARTSLVADWCRPAHLGRSLAQVPDVDQLLVDGSVHLGGVPEAALQQVAAAAGLQDWGSKGGSWGWSSQGGSWGSEGFFVMSGSAKDTVEEEALRRCDSIFRYLQWKALGHFQHFGWKSLDILAGIEYSWIKKSSCLLFSWVLSALPVQLPMPGCLALTAAIVMQKYPGSVKLTCLENQSHIMRRLENWKYKELPATGYICNMYY